MFVTKNDMICALWQHTKYNIKELSNMKRKRIKKLFKDIILGFGKENKGGSRWKF